MKVSNMINSNGNKVPNQFIITDGNIATYFQSYKSIIVKKINGRTLLDRDKWNYSRTTARYRNLFLGETTEQTKKNIEEDRYILTNLN